jgi:hypothetical protein
MSKDFTINYQGKQETITVNDKPKAGTVFKIAEYSVDWSSSVPKIKFREYFISLATNLIVKAPWGETTPDVLNNMDIDTFEEVATILANILPIERFLSLGARGMYGKKLDDTKSQSNTESTTNSQSGV